MSHIRILVVDDQEGLAQSTADNLALNFRHTDFDGRLRFEAASDFPTALGLLEDGRFDLAILDVIDQQRAQQAGYEIDDPEVAGRLTFERVREVRYLPVIFYTAAPQDVEDLLEPPFVDLVEKGADDDGSLFRSVEGILESGLPALLAALEEQVAGVARRFLADFVEPHWEYLSQRPWDLAHLLLRRLAMSIERSPNQLGEALGLQDMPDDGLVPAGRCYIQPPVGKRLATGDLLRHEDGWRIALTPECDFEHDRRLEHVVLARATPLEEFEEYDTWVKSRAGEIEKKPKNAERDLIRFLRGQGSGRQQDRYFYLPAAWAVPPLVVDLQRIEHMDRETLEVEARVATLDSPFSQAVVAQFQRFFGRIGTPDVDLTTHVEVDLQRPDG